MSKLDKFYGPLSGLNTRVNKLASDPKSFRNGSKNFRFNFLDEIQNANGFQHKSIYGFTSVGEIEYKYTDIDTGESKFQHLAVGTDGFLYRKKYQYIKFTSLGTATTYSFYYDENYDTFKLKLNSYAAINVSETMTMTQLVTAINALGPVCEVVDESGVTVIGSTKLAYLLDVVIDQALTVSTIDTMNTQYWDKISSGGGFTVAPFPTSRDFNTDPNYQGISYVNINNSCIITDGGFPMKYDGVVVYRAGQPKILAPRQVTDAGAFADSSFNYSGISLSGSSNPKGEMTPDGLYKYVFQIGSLDAQGVETIGGYDLGASNLYIQQSLNKGQNSMAISLPSFLDGGFNWFRCRVIGGKNLPDAGGTIDVAPSHNVSIGQTLRIPLSNKELIGYSGIASTTNASAIITGLTNTSKIEIHAPITGTNIQSGSTVVSIDSETQITISKTATATGLITNLLTKSVGGYSYLMTKVNDVSYGYRGSASLVNGSPIVTGLDTSTLKVGALIYGVTSVTAGTRILTIDSATQITMDLDAIQTITETEFLVAGTVSVDIGRTETSSWGPNTSTQYPYQSIGYQRVSTTSGSATMFVGLSTSIGHTITTTSGSNIATISAGPGDELREGMFVRSTHFPNTAKITKVNSATEVVISENATNTGSVSASFQYDYTGYYFEGEGLAAGTVVTAQTADNATISPAATATTSLGYKLYHAENTLLIDNQTLSAGYVESKYENTITDVNVENLFLPQVLNGSFLRVWRSTKDTDLLYHLIDLDIPTDDTTFIDLMADTASYQGSTQPAPWTLSRKSLVDAVQGSELPRACKYLAKWQDRLVQMGRPVNTLIKDDAYPTFYFYGIALDNEWGEPLTGFVGQTYTESALCDFQSIYWSSSDGVESFPQDGLHEFLIESNANDQITGGSSNKDAFFAFKSRSTGVLVGSLAENNLQLELLESEIGCSSHRSIQEVAGSLIWLDADNGFYSCVAGRLPIPIGFPISDYQQLNLQKLDYTKAVSGLYRKENLYFCAVGSTTFVYDYVNQGPKDRSVWYLWDRIDTKGFLQSSTGEFFLSDGTRQWKMKVTNTKYDFTDHKSAIPFVVNTAWLTQGLPTIDKQFTNLWVNSIQGDFELDFYQYQNFLDYSIAENLCIPFLAESSAKKLVKVQFKAANPKISGVSFGMQNNTKNAFIRIQGFEVEYVAAFDTSEPKK